MNSWFTVGCDWFIFQLVDAVNKSNMICRQSALMSDVFPLQKILVVVGEGNSGTFILNLNTKVRSAPSPAPIASSFPRLVAKWGRQRRPPLSALCFSMR